MSDEKDKPGFFGRLFGRGKEAPKEAPKERVQEAPKTEASEEIKAAEAASVPAPVWPHKTAVAASQIAATRNAATHPLVRPAIVFNGISRGPS